MRSESEIYRRSLHLGNWIPSLVFRCRTGIRQFDRVYFPKRLPSPDQSAFLGGAKMMMTRASRVYDCARSQTRNVLLEISRSRIVRTTREPDGYIYI